jgi:calpain-15
MWVMVLEKAYAKMYGSYARIDGGNPAMALRDLTGAPYENKDDGTADELWQYMWENY